jgi:carboxymethylenebutenolidase
MLSGGRNVSVEVYGRPQPHRDPAILFLHGSDGPRGHGYAHQRSAADLAGHGFTVFLVHYFDRTGTMWASSKAIGENYLAWLETVADAVALARSHPAADGAHVGIIGFSLGASLALTAASQDLRVAAVTEVSAAVPPAAVSFLQHMPPALILHGADDNIVPVENAYRLEALLKSSGVPCELHVYPDQEHSLTGAAVRDAIIRAASFFEKTFQTEAESVSAE